MASRHRVRQIDSGKSAQFPAIGTAAAEYHKPGDVILGQSVAHGEKVITIDDMLISSVFVANYEEAMNHYDVRSEYTFQQGYSMAQAYDQHLFAIATKACVNGDTGAVAGMDPATQENIGVSPTLATLTSAIFAGAAHFDTKNVPANDRFVVVPSTVYWDLIEDGSMLHRDFGNNQASQANGGQLHVAGFQVVASNNLNLNFGVATLAGKRAGATITDYTVDGTATMALLVQKQALGTVELMHMKSEKTYQVERQGTLMVTKKAVGHGVLKPACLRRIAAIA
ncbi:MAG: hypothetical protein JKY49_00485 [Cohaesibacteraceae bacterium]|nr:hypothetical protein [Cohaesibacteraceae bacterium]